ncbi:MAG: helicase associated domain-containing protein [Bifidobacteriaceae bacterium]|nr:helicase associated domain-containing protein [Bifidobacteriaceae bacterium]
MSRLRRDWRAGRLAEAELAVIDRLVPGWNRSPEAKRVAAHAERVAEYRRFRDTQGRTPGAEADDPVEAGLYAWMASRRSAAYAGKITGVERELLDRELPGWDQPRLWAAEGRARKHASRALDYRQFLDSNGRRPSEQAAGADERALARWMTRRRKAARARKLAASHKDGLDEVLPGWDDESATGRGSALRPPSSGVLEDRIEWHVKRALEYKRFEQVRGRKPRARSGNADERSLAQWLDDRRLRLHAGEMGESERSAISGSLPGWDAPSGRPPQGDLLRRPFGTMLRELERILAAGGGIPAYGHPVGRWLATQRRLASRGELDPEQVTALDRACPRWRLTREDGVDVEAQSDRSA